MDAEALLPALMTWVAVFVVVLALCLPWAARGKK